MITLEMIDKVIERIKTSTLKETISIKIKPDDNLTIFDSKFGGIPYLPSDKNVPLDSNDVQLALLAQINCKDLPENNIYPKTGILQFWIGRDDIMGLDDEAGAKVIYYPTLDSSITLEDILEKYTLLDDDNDDEYSPFYKKNTTFALEFKLDTMPLSCADYNLDNQVISTINKLYPEETIENLYNDLHDDVHEKLYEELYFDGHRIGGYPHFTQDDPRGWSEKKYDTLLLQVDSEWGNYDKQELMWGDSGIANFFISKEDLENLNFDNVLYNWNCC